MPSFAELKQKINKCTKCKGSGTLIEECEEGLRIVGCKCMKEIDESIKFMQANIPDQYWGFTLDNLNAHYSRVNKESLLAVRKYLDNLDRNLRNGKGIWFCSPPGLGKSTVICCILKEALDRGHTSYFIRASHMIHLKFDALRNRESADLINYIVREVDILAVEEIEKIYLLNDDAMNNQLFYEFISDVHDAKKALLLSSNLPKKDVMKKFPTFVQDRLRSLARITFIGTSERARLK
jgi:DNA replication protein DnaC